MSERTATTDPADTAWDVAHVTFNPQPLGAFDSPLSRILADWERGGWVLLRVVPHHQYESVAVFVRGDENGSDRAPSSDAT